MYKVLIYHSRMSLEEEFSRVLRMCIEDTDSSSHFDVLSDLLKQGAKGHMNGLVDITLRKGCNQYVKEVEIVNFLLSEGVLPDMEIIESCLYTGDVRLLEDLLKYYDGPPVIKINCRLSTHRLCQLAEVCYGFHISLMLCISIREIKYTLSLLEHCILDYSVNLDAELYRKFIEQAKKICPPPNMELVEYLATLGNIDMNKVRKAFQVYQGKNDSIREV